MFLLVLLLLLLLVEKIEYKDISSTSSQEEYLNQKYTNQLRGFFAVMVIYSHLALQIDQTGIFNVFSNFGNYAVGVFFFLSGYGLLVQYKKKGRTYLKGFLWRRVIVSLLIPYLIFNIIYYVSYMLLEKQVTVLDMLVSLINGHPLVSNSWYIIAIFYFYLVFYISAIISAKRLRLITSLCFVGSLAWMMICHGMGYGDWWFYSCFTFNAGMIWVLVHEKAESWFREYFWMKEVGVLITCIALYYAAIILPQYIGMQTLIYLGCMQISAVMFCVFVICLGIQVRFTGKCLSLLGKCSLELYLIHGLFISLLRSEKIYLDSNMGFSLAVVALSVLVAVVLHKMIGSWKRCLL